jgi:hypothetical protein
MTHCTNLPLNCLRLAYLNDKEFQGEEEFFKPKAIQAFEQACEKRLHSGNVADAISAQDEEEEEVIKSADLEEDFTAEKEIAESEVAQDEHEESNDENEDQDQEQQNNDEQEAEEDDQHEHKDQQEVEENQQQDDQEEEN